MSVVSPDRRFWDQLLGSIEEGQVVPIVGQDLLVVDRGGAKVPLYRLLAGELASYLEVSTADLPAGSELNEVVCRYFQPRPDHPEPDPTYVYSGLKKVSEGLEIEVPEPLVQLAEITPFELFVTTTFDDCLERALRDVRGGGVEILKYTPSDITDDQRLGKLHGTAVYHLFGQLSSITKSFAVTEADILEFVYSLMLESKRPKVLLSELMQNQLLILGCSFPDWLARFFISIARGAPVSEGQTKSFLADTSVQEDPHLTDFLQAFSAKTVHVFSEGGAAEFVRQLRAHWEERHPTAAVPATAAPAAEAAQALPEIARGAVFLSYAREDQEDVRRIRDALDENGIDTWFDEKSLGFGDPFQDKILRAIKNCSLFLPIVSAHVLTDAPNRFFRLEWREALEVAKRRPFGSTFILPTAIDETPVRAEALPDGFRDLNWAWMPGDHDQLLAEVAQLYRKFQKTAT